MAQGGSDSDGAEEEEEERGAARWGRNKQAYYNTDDVSDEDDAELEEEEADRLQKRQLAGVGKEFFGGDSSDEEDDEEDGQRASGSGKTEDVPLGERRKAGAGGKASGPKSAPSLLDRLQQPLAAGAGDPEAERIDRAADKLSRKQRLSIVQRESPELISLLAQFKRSVAQLREQVQPVMQKVKVRARMGCRGAQGCRVSWSVVLLPPYSPLALSIAGGHAHGAGHQLPGGQVPPAAGLLHQRGLLRPPQGPRRVGAGPPGGGRAGRVPGGPGEDQAPGRQAEAPDRPPAPRGGRAGGGVRGR